MKNKIIFFSLVIFLVTHAFGMQPDGFSLRWSSAVNKTDKTILIQRVIQPKDQSTPQERTLREISGSVKPESAVPQVLNIPINWEQLTAQGESAPQELYADFIIRNKNKPQEQIRVYLNFTPKSDILSYTIFSDKEKLTERVIARARNMVSGLDLVIAGSDLKSTRLNALAKEPVKLQPKTKPQPAIAKILDDRPVVPAAAYSLLGVAQGSSAAAILGVSETADETEAQKSYRKLAIKYHPDKTKDPLAADTFKLVTWAYEKIKSGGRPMVAPYVYERMGVRINADPEEILGVKKGASLMQILNAAELIYNKFPLDENDSATFDINRLLEWSYNELLKYAQS